MCNDVAPTGILQRVDEDGNICRDVRGERFGTGVKTVPTQEKCVISQSHAVLLRPCRSTKAAQAVNEDYALLMHSISLFHGPDIQ